MSKYSDKTFEKTLDEMPNRVKECDALEGSFIYTALTPFAMELVLVYLQLEEDEKNGFADTADYEHLKWLALDRGMIPCNIILDLIVIYNQYSMFTKYTYGELRTMTHKYMREHYFGES